LEFLKKIIQTNLFKITSLNSLSVLIKFGIGLITSKSLAIFVGPSGMALVGNFRNFMSALEGISTLAFSPGIVKYIGDNEYDKYEIKKIITTILLSFIVIAFFLSLLIFLFSDYLSFRLFGNYMQYSILFKVVAIVLPWNAVSVLYISIINGLGAYKKVIFANIVSNILVLILSLVLIYQFKTMGALFSISIIPVVLVSVNAFFLPKELVVLKGLSFKEYDFNIFKNLFTFSLMILPSTILSPFINLQIRNFLIASVDVNSGGLWEALSRISNIYLVFVSTIVSIYFYPRLIKAKESKETKLVLWSFYKFILPTFILGTVLVYFFRFLIVKLLFTKAFLPITELFFWQLIGDIFKVAGMILGFQLLAKKRMLPYVCFELLSFFCLYFLSLFFIRSQGIEGAVIAQALDNFIYLFILIFYFRKKIFSKPTQFCK
jgi:PST family polysaccharide transporter